MGQGGVALDPTYHPQRELAGHGSDRQADSVTAIAIACMHDGKTAETWINTDTLGMVQQLGLIPAPGQAS